MSATLVGADDLKARLKALRQGVFKPAAKAWAQEAADIARSEVGGMSMPYSGDNLKRSKPQAQLLPSIKVKSATMRKAVVVASYHSYFVDAGPKAHSLRARKSRPKSGAGRTIFAATARKRHPGYAARPFRGKAAARAYEKHPVQDYVYKAWNGAA